ncbi:MAG TPA: polyphenol oxidase family protein [Thermoanaerobaculia bacterium]|nr:polyphenol oxidase family protein [Thermoanaerobaculia bacterium]
MTGRDRTHPHGPEERAGYPVWEARGEGAEVRFVGRHHGEPHDLPRQQILAAVTTPDAALGGPPAPTGLAEARQVHGADVLHATGPGRLGNADALFTREPGLALSVITADCVPVLLEAGEWVAAVHAGWRGLVAGTVAATAERLRAAGAPPPGAWTAWVGPTIGLCCYEVGEEVAAEVEAVVGSGPVDPEVVVRREGTRPHLDLVAAAHHQLAAAGVGTVRWVVRCTRCDDENLWSYRRLGKLAGRNIAFIWKSRGRDRHPQAAQDRHGQ